MDFTTVKKALVELIGKAHEARQEEGVRNVIGILKLMSVMSKQRLLYAKGDGVGRYQAEAVLLDEIVSDIQNGPKTFDQERT